METRKINLGRVGLVPKGAYSPDATYGRMHVVTYKNTTYWSKQEGNTGHEPLGEDDWWGIIVDGQAAYAGAFNAMRATERANTAAEKAEQTNIAVWGAEQARASAEEERKTAETQREEQAQGMAAAEQTRTDAEQRRAEAETQRVEAEKSRASEETLRAAAEDTRKSDEADRIAGETSREQQEDSRVAAEQTRDADEAQRKIDETKRAGAETKRADAEDARKEAETGRASAETDRAAAETDRAAAETARAKAETARADAETQRAAAETKRETDFSAKVEEVDTAVTNAKTATSEAEKVDATITDANVLEVTGRDGVKKSLELVGQAEASEMKTELAEVASKTNELSENVFNSTELSNNAFRENVYIKSDGGVATSVLSNKLISYTDINEGDLLLFKTIKTDNNSLAYAFYSVFPNPASSFPACSTSTFISGDTENVEVGVEHQYIVSVPKGALSLVVSQSSNNQVVVIRRSLSYKESIENIEEELLVDVNGLSIPSISNYAGLVRVPFRELIPNAKIIVFTSTNNSYTLCNKDQTETIYNCKIGQNRISVDTDVITIKYTNKPDSIVATQFYENSESLKKYTTENTSDIIQSLSRNSKIIDNYIFGIEKKDIDVSWLGGAIDNKGGGYYGSSPRAKHVEIDLKYYDSICMVFKSKPISFINGLLSPCLIRANDGALTKIGIAKDKEIIIASGQYPDCTLIVNVSLGDEIVIQGNKTPISSNSDNSFLPIIQISGDSLTNQLPSVMNDMVALKNGYTCTGTAGGGEISLVNLINMGGIAFLPQNEVTIPASGESPAFKVFANWRNSEGNYKAIKFNNTSDGGGCRINGEKFSMQAVPSPYAALTLYTEDGAVVESFTGTSKTIALSAYPTAKKLKITVNYPASNVAHLSVGNKNYVIADVATQNGGIVKDTGIFASDTSYRCSDFIELPTESTSIYYDGLASDDAISLTRIEAGAAFKINESTKIYVEKKWGNAKKIHIIFTGQNGGYENEDDYVNQIWSSTRQFKDNQFLVATSYGFPNGSLENNTIVTTPALAQKMTAKFGERYLNLREYFEKQSVNDAIRLEYINEGHSYEEWKTLFIADGIHPNEIGKKLIVLAMWNKMLDLDMVKGDYL